MALILRSELVGQMCTFLIFARYIQKKKQNLFYPPTDPTKSLLPQALGTLQEIPQTSRHKLSQDPPGASPGPSKRLPSQPLEPISAPDQVKRGTNVRSSLCTKRIADGLVGTLTMSAANAGGSWYCSTSRMEYSNSNELSEKVFQIS